jgi:hypothetical protein
MYFLMNFEPYRQCGIRCFCFVLYEYSVGIDGISFRIDDYNDNLATIFKFKISRNWEGIS